MGSLVRELRNAALAFAVVLSVYGITSSSYLASFGFTYDQTPAAYVAFSTVVYALIGAALGILSGLVFHFLGRAIRARLEPTSLQIAFHLVAATTSLYALHGFLRILSGYVLVRWDQSARIPILTALALVAAATGILLAVVRASFARTERGGLVLVASTLTIAVIGGASVASHLGLFSGRIEDARDNVILISIDTLRADHLSPFAETRVKTPAIDALARDGVVFRTTYATSPYTWPALSSVLTGKYPPKHGVRHNGIKLPEANQTLVELFHEAGYETTGMSDIGLRWMGFSQGVGRILKDDTGLFELQPFRRMMPFLPRFSNWFVAKPGTINSSLPQTLVALRWLRAAKHFSRQLFWFHFYDDSPHAPTMSPEPYESMYVEPGNRSSYTGDEQFIFRINRGELEPTQDDQEKIRDLYDGQISWVDSEVGALIQALKDRGIYDEATIVFFADHGEMFGRRGYYGHSYYLYNELLHVPLIIKPPRSSGLRSGIAIDRPVASTDVFPTLAEMYGLDYDAGRIDGRSLFRFLQKGEDPSYRFWHYADTYNYAWSDASQGLPYRVGFAVIDDQWKTIQSPEVGEYHLYARDDDAEKTEIDDPSRMAEMRRQAVEYFGLSGVDELTATDSTKVPEATRKKLEALGYIVK